MSTPMASVQTAQAAQQQIQNQETTPKTGPSKFDQALANKSDSVAHTSASNQVTVSHQAQSIQKAGQTEQMQRASSMEKTSKARGLRLNDPAAATSSTSKMGKSIQNLFVDLEDRHASMDKFINSAINGKVDLSHQQLLGLQARVSQYSLELDLTSKIVEKATTGLKDTLRTQV